jgi:hypothetical protein
MQRSQGMGCASAYIMKLVLTILKRNDHQQSLKNFGSPISLIILNCIQESFAHTMPTDGESKSLPVTSTMITAQASLPESKSHSLRFWGIFPALCLLAFISALDVAIITTALPKIAADIGSVEQDYVWIANSFVLAFSVIQPLVSQLADIFGR